MLHPARTVNDPGHRLADTCPAKTVIVRAATTRAKMTVGRAFARCEADRVFGVNGVLSFLGALEDELRGAS